MKTFVTSSSRQEAIYGKLMPILVLEKDETKQRNLDHIFLERYLPRTEKEVRSLLTFRKRRKRSARFRLIKKASN